MWLSLFKPDKLLSKAKVFKGKYTKPKWYFQYGWRKTVGLFFCVEQHNCYNFLADRPFPYLVRIQNKPCWDLRLCSGVSITLLSSFTACLCVMQASHGLFYTMWPRTCTCKCTWPIYAFTWMFFSGHRPHRPDWIP